MTFRVRDQRAMGFRNQCNDFASKPFDQCAQKSKILIRGDALGSPYPALQRLGGSREAPDQAVDLLAATGRYLQQGSAEGERRNEVHLVKAAGRLTENLAAQSVNMFEPDPEVLHVEPPP